MGSNTGDVYALNASDGTKLWNSTIGEGRLSAPALYDYVLYFGSSDGNLYALNATNGLELWTYPVSSPISWDFSSWGVGGGVGSPVVCDGVLFVGGEGIFALAVSSSFVLPSLSLSMPGFSLFGLSIFSVLLVVGVAVVIVVCCVWVFLLKKRHRPNELWNGV